MTRYFPIVFFQLYLTFSVLLFAFGPWPWPVQSPVKLYGFLFLAQVSLLWGYLRGLNGGGAIIQSKLMSKRYLHWSLLCTLVLLLPTSYARLGSIVPNVLQGLSNPGDVYYEFFMLRNTERSAIAFEYLRVVFGPLLVAQTPLIVFYWSRLDLHTKILGVFATSFTTAIYLAGGLNKALADLVVLTPWLVIGSVAAGITRVSRGMKVAICLLVAVGFLQFFSFFALGQATRYGSATAAGVFPAANIRADPTNWIVALLPEDARGGVFALSQYLNSGYYALGLALEKPFVWTYGVGNSFFLLQNAARITGYDEIGLMPYPMRLEEDGWNSLGLWSSIYPWIASDVTFPGTLLFVAWVGQQTAQSWLDALTGRNPLAVVMFYQLAMMLYYFPANNQCLQNGEQLVAFVVTLLLWRLRRSHQLDPVDVLAFRAHAPTDKSCGNALNSCGYPGKKGSAGPIA
jgi:hypothetical protein